MTVLDKEKKRYDKKQIPWFVLLRLSGIILFIIIISRVDIKGIWVEIVRTDIWFILLAILLQLVMLFAKAIRWHMLNEPGSSKSMVHSFGEFFESYAIGIITPGRLGELMKAGYQDKRIYKIAAAVRVGAERSLDFGLFIMIAGLALYFSEFIKGIPLIGILIAGIGVLVFVFGIALFSSKKVNELLDRFIPGFLDTYLRRKGINIAWIMFLSILSNLFYFISCYVIAAYALKMRMTLVMLFGGIATAGLVNLIPITVMGLGTREMTFLYIFRAYPENLVLALSGLVFAVAQVGGGILSLLLGQFFLHTSYRRQPGLQVNKRKKNG